MVFFVFLIADPVTVGDTLPPEPATPATPHCAPRVRDGHASIQVNVDARGCNILADAANEPSIAIDPTDPRKIVIGWRHFDSVFSEWMEAGYAYSHDGGHTWVFPGVLEEADSFLDLHSDPVLDTGPDGTFYFIGARFEGNDTLFKSRDGGVTWEGLPGYSGDKPWLAIDRSDRIGRGNLYITSNNVLGFPRGFGRSVDGGASFEVLERSENEVPVNPFYVSVGPDGTVYVADWSGCVTRSVNAQDPNQRPTFEKPTCTDVRPAGGAQHGRTECSNLRSDRPFGRSLARQRLPAGKRGPAGRRSLLPKYRRRRDLE